MGAPVPGKALKSIKRDVKSSALTSLLMAESAMLGEVVSVSVALKEILMSGCAP